MALPLTNQLGQRLTDRQLCYAAINELPYPLRRTARTLPNMPGMRQDLEQIMSRVDEFDSPLHAFLVAIGMNPRARDKMNDAMDAMWARQRRAVVDQPEVVIGAGLHAAIYCAVRVARGWPMPIVLEGSDTVGGAFALSRNPSFYLNSRNRPGALGVPGQALGLNVLPGAMVQPCDIGVAEFQTNADLAWSIRTTLALRSVVVPNTRVASVETYLGQLIMRDEAGRRLSTFNPRRVIIATGLGSQRKVVGSDSERVLGFNEFMRLADQPFPLRGLKRVAVIGGGDSGKTAVEMLVGQGPPSGLSSAALDYVPEIDWYGCPASDKFQFQETQRSRYKRLGCLLPPADEGRARVMPQPLLQTLTRGFNQVQVNNRPYDLAVVCTGYLGDAPTREENSASTFAVDGRALALRDTNSVGQRTEIYTVGPAARLAVDSYESDNIAALRNVPENATAVFRYADRTATLAAELPGF